MAQPRGPYLFGGYSFGGVVAFEMTRQLQLAGEPADTLILMDAFAPSARLNRLFTSWAGSGVLLQVVTNLLGREWKARELLSAGALPPEDSRGAHGHGSPASASAMFDTARFRSAEGLS